METKYLFDEELKQLVLEIRVLRDKHNRLSSLYKALGLYKKIVQEYETDILPEIEDKWIKK